MRKGRILDLVLNKGGCGEYNGGFGWFLIEVVFKVDAHFFAQGVFSKSMSLFEIEIDDYFLNIC